MNKILEKAREVLDIEIAGLYRLRDELGAGFEALIQECFRVLDRGNKLVLSGVGKSGHIGKKIAATLASTGSPAVFMHPVEAMHGDLGLLRENDLLLALSYSGETEELLNILPAARRFNVKIVAITGNANSKLGQWSDIIVPMPVEQEACPFNLAPTTSTTALLALGDAMAITLLKLRGFTREDYGRLHPGGAIGRAVTLKVTDVMRSGDRLALVTSETTVKDTLLSMTRRRCGSAIVVDADSRLLGIFTDGDFRRRAEEDITILERAVGEFMTRNPAAIYADQMAVDVLNMIEAKRVDDVVVIDRDRRVAGLVDIQDLPGLKLM